MKSVEFFLSLFFCFLMLPIHAHPQQLILGHAKTLSLEEPLVGVTAHLLPYPEETLNKSTLEHKSHSAPFLFDYSRKNSQLCYKTALLTPWCSGLAGNSVTILDSLFRSISQPLVIFHTKALPINFYSFILGWELPEMMYDHFHKSYHRFSHRYLPTITLYTTDTQRKKSVPLKKIDLFGAITEYAITREQEKEHDFSCSPFHTTLEHRFIIIAHKSFWQAFEETEHNILHHNELSPNHYLSCYERVISIIDEYLLDRETTNPLTQYEADCCAQKLLALAYPPSFGSTRTHEEPLELFIVFMYPAVL